MRFWPLPIGLLVVGLALCAQSPQPEVGPGFEAASLKRAAADAKPAMEGGPGTADPGRIRYSGLPLRLILQYCWGIQASRIIGPDWLDKDTFELTAKIPPDATREQFQLMLQRLLAERMGLEFHHETRDLDGYELLTAKNGIKMTRSALTVDDQKPRPYLERGPDGNRQLPSGHASVQIAIPLETGLKRISARLRTAAQIARMCSDNLDGEVVDKTGLTGRYDFNLDFAYTGPRGPRITPEQLAAMPTPDGPDFATALRQQLGLQLIPIKIPTDLVVIDRINRVPAGD